MDWAGWFGSLNPVSQSHQQAPTSIKGSSSQTCEHPGDADPQASNAMSMVFSVLCQEIKSYTVIGKQAGEFKGIACVLTGNLLAEIILVLLLNWEREREREECCQRAQTMACPFLDLFHIKITSEFRFLSHVAWKKEQVGTQVLSSFFSGHRVNTGSPFPIAVLVCWDTWLGIHAAF